MNTSHDFVARCDSCSLRMKIALLKKAPTIFACVSCKTEIRSCVTRMGFSAPQNHEAFTLLYLEFVLRVQILKINARCKAYIKYTFIKCKVCLSTFYDQKIMYRDEYLKVIKVYRAVIRGV